MTTSSALWPRPRSVACRVTRTASRQGSGSTSTSVWRTFVPVPEAVRVHLPSPSSWPSLRGGVLGSIGPAANGKPSYVPARLVALVQPAWLQPAQRPSPSARQRRHHPGPRPRRARGRERGRSAARRCPAYAPSSRSSPSSPARSGSGSRATPSRPRRSATSSSSGSTASPRSWPRPPRATPPSSRCSPRTPSSPTRPRSCARRCVAAAGLEAEVEEVAGGRRDAPTRPDRAPGRPAVGHLAPAGQPVPGPDFSGAATATAPDPPAGHLGAARSAVPVLRVRRRRCDVLHAPARAGVAPAPRRATS